MSCIKWKFLITSIRFDTIEWKKFFLFIIIEQFSLSAFHYSTVSSSCYPSTTKKQQRRIESELEMYSNWINASSKSLQFQCELCVADLSHNFALFNQPSSIFWFFLIFLSHCNTQCDNEFSSAKIDLKWHFIAILNAIVLVTKRQSMTQLEDGTK